ncbi:hypothetical protein CC78DRAFT_173328 [Lojkania enalia]|uniref:Uncharacterized protein n=1 Tax=Lojkania enalia TaxID=147567 RepID=A0A9P4KBR6_9PLEO|nr:hypothetical protein CC78DRAFT_173328 [Didymosphaeria enalia]
MAPRAYAAAFAARTHLNFAARPMSPPPILSTKSTPLISSPRPGGQPWDQKFNNHGGHSNPSSPSRLSTRMSTELSANKPHWLSSLRSCLRILIIVLSGTVVTMLVHTLEIYRGNRYLDLRKGELPMTWPARTNLAPTLILFTVAAGNFLASGAIVFMSFKKAFRRPIRSRDMYRIVAGSFAVVFWVAALVTFHLLDKASKASLGRYACTNRNVMSNGRYQYRAVCSEQGVAFYVAIGAATAELLTLVTLAISAVISARRPTLIHHEKLRNDDEEAPASLKSSGRFP